MKLLPPNSQGMVEDISGLHPRAGTILQSATPSSLQARHGPRELRRASNFESRNGMEERRKRGRKTVMAHDGTGSVSIRILDGHRLHGPHFDRLQPQVQAMDLFSGNKGPPWTTCRWQLGVCFMSPGRPLKAPGGIKVKYFFRHGIAIHKKCHWIPRPRK